MRLAGETQVLAIALPVVIQMPLEPFEDLQRHGVRSCEIAIEAPAEELAQADAPHRHGGRGIVVRFEPEQIPIQQRGESLRITRITGQRFADELTHGQVSSERGSENERPQRTVNARNTSTGNAENVNVGRTSKSALSRCGGAAMCWTATNGLGSPFHG